MPTLIPIPYHHSTPEQDAMTGKLFLGFLLMSTIVLIIYHLYCYLKYKKEKQKSDFFNYINYKDYIESKHDLLDIFTSTILIIYFLVFLFVGGYYLINLF
jgi:hypothetical protein